MEHAEAEDETVLDPGREGDGQTGHGDEDHADEEGGAGTVFVRDDAAQDLGQCGAIEEAAEEVGLGRLAPVEFGLEKDMLCVALGVLLALPCRE